MNKLCVDKQKVVQELEDIGTKVAAMLAISLFYQSVLFAFDGYKKHLWLAFLCLAVSIALTVLCFACNCKFTSKFTEPELQPPVDDWDTK